jgi:serine/threonine-protein kinase
MSIKSDPADKYLGRVFGEYETLERVGGSKTGPIYKARHRTRGNVVTLKLLPPEAVRSPEVLKRFRREVELTTRLDHPNLMVAYESGEQEGVHYLSMEYTSGTDLATLLEQKGPPSIEQALDYFLQAAKGLEYLHASGVYHRNIKPHNLMVDGRGTLKIANLLLAGLEEGSALAGEQEDLTKTGTAMGSIDYLAPEQAADAKSADHRADQYALGCTLYHLLTGQVIYPGKNLVQKAVQHREAPIPSLRTLRPETPEEIDRIFQRMVAKAPRDRFDSMSAVIRKLEPQGRPLVYIILPAAVIVLFLLVVILLYAWR